MKTHRLSATPGRAWDRREGVAPCALVARDGAHSHERARRSRTIALCVGVLLIAASARAVDIPITVAEPSGAARTGETVTSGVPLPPGTQTSNWKLLDGSTELPIQVTPLPVVSGKPPWILLDFQVDLPANGSKTLTLSEGTSRASFDALSINETSSQITVNTGPLEVVMKKSPFDLFHSVSRNGSRVFNSDGNNIRMVDVTTGETYYGTGTPDLMEWEYEGDVRSTLRVDGRFGSGGSSGFDAATNLRYTLRISFFAGQSAVKIEYVLRNSYEPNERHVKLSSATLVLGSGGSTVRPDYRGATEWASVGSSGLTFELVPSSLWGINTSNNGGMVVPDLSYHGAAVVADFSQGLSSGEAADRANAARNPLFGLAPSSQYSLYGELTTTRFSSLQDERDAYESWGWSWSSGDEPRDQLAEGAGGFIPDYTVHWAQVDVHRGTESDDLWQHLLMYLRTGRRSYWDRARGWARYRTWEYSYRTDGFDYASDGPWEGPSQVNRSQLPCSLNGTDRDYLDDLDNPQGGRVDIGSWGMTHVWGWGIVDYYYLTGDVDALASAADLAECSVRVLGWRNPGDHRVSGYGVRQEARHFLTTTRVYEGTGDSRWLSHADHLAQLFIQSPDWDERGSYLGSVEGFDKGVAHFHLGFLNHAFDRYLRLTGNSRVREIMIAMGDFAKNYGIDPDTRATGKIIFDSPNPGDWFHMSVGDRLYTTTFVDTLVRAYRLTDDASYLARAKTYWGLGGKSRYGSLEPTAGADEVGRFMNYNFAHSGVRRYYTNLQGDLTYAHLLFFEYNNADNPPDDPDPNPDPEPEDDSVAPEPPSRVTVR